MNKAARAGIACIIHSQSEKEETRYSPDLVSGRGLPGATVDVDAFSSVKQLHAHVMTHLHFTTNALKLKSLFIP